MQRLRQHARQFHLPQVLPWALFLALALPALALAADDHAYDLQEIMAVAQDFFGEVSEGLAKAIDKVFAEHGRPDAYLTGEERDSALGVGVRYGEGHLFRKVGLSSLAVFWTGPSAGFDFGANLRTKVFTLVYNLQDPEQLFQRFPGVEGSFYLVAGVGMNYYSAAGMRLVPIRSGVRDRQEASAGYVHYTEKRTWLPF